MKMLLILASLVWPTSFLVSTPNTTLFPTQGGRKVVKTEAEWKKTLTPDQFNILRKEGTERAFSSPLNDVHEQGVFYCAGCHNAVFAADTKFDSGTGWPSFYKPITKNAVTEKVDKAYGMARTEIECSVCGGHLGHVFDDGPKPTGLRYCMNGIAMTFEKADPKKVAGK